MSERDKLRREHVKNLDALEATVFVHLYRSLIDWLNRVLDRVLTPFRMFHVKPDPAAVWGLVKEWEQVADHLTSDHLVDVVRHGWEFSGRGHPYVSGNSFTQAQLARTHNLLMRIPDEVYQLIFAEISDGANAGESVGEIAERIDRVLSNTASERWFNRARTIARTETIRAYNAGALGSGLRAQELEQVPMMKEWLATEDSRTRPSHREADGQQRLLLEPFRVGGSSLMFPVDPLAQPEEVINCRCTMLIKESR